MKTKIEIILGFLESGKTSFINSMLKNNDLHNKTIVIIQDEFGQTEIRDEFLISNENVKVITLINHPNEEINETYINRVLTKYSPDKIFIEVNGMKDSTPILNIFNNKNIKRLCKIEDVVAIIDAKKFHMYFKNMKNIIFNQVFNSNAIIFNNLSYLNKIYFSKIQKEVRKINETANLIEHVDLLNKKFFYPV